MDPKNRRQINGVTSSKNQLLPLKLKSGYLARYITANGDIRM